MALLAAVLLLSLVSIAAAVPRELLQTANPTFTNGDFSLPGTSILNSGGFATLTPQTPDAITGWVITSGSVDYVSTQQWQAPPGASYVVDVSGDEAGSIQQTFVTVPASQYTVTFQLAGSPLAGVPIRTLQVSAAGTVSNFTFDITNPQTTPQDMGYLPQTFVFTASDTSTTLVFTSLTNEREGPVIGDVIVSGAGISPGSAPAVAGQPATSPTAAGSAVSASAASAASGSGPAPAPGSATLIVASFIVPQPLTVVNTSSGLSAMAAALNSDFATANTTAVITSVAAGPNPANQTAVTFEMQPTTGAALPADQLDNLRAGLTTTAENLDPLQLPANYSPASNFSVVSFPGGASVIGSGAPYSSPTANSTFGLLTFQLPQGVQNVSAKENMLLQQIATNLGLKPSEVLTATLAAANGSANATAVSIYLTLIGISPNSSEITNVLAGTASAALKNGTLGLSPAVFGTPSNITPSPALAALLAGLPLGATLAPGSAPAPAPGSATPIIASFIVPQPLSAVNTSSGLAALTAALNSDFATPNTTAVITSVAAGPNPANETAVTFEMQPTTGGALPADQLDNLRAGFTSTAENLDPLQLPANYSPASNFSVVSFPGGAGVIGSGAPYGSPTANSTFGLFNFQLPQGVQDVSANRTLLLEEIATNLGLKPSEVLTATFAAANGSANATAVSTYITMVGSFANNTQMMTQLAGNSSAAANNGTLGLDPAVFGTPSNIALSPALAALLGGLPAGAPGTAPAPAPGSGTGPIVASFIVPQPLTAVNTSTGLAALTAALNFEFATPNTTAVITSVAAGPNPANETAVTFQMQPTTSGPLPADQVDNLRAGFTTAAENLNPLALPAPFSPASNFTVGSFPGGASVIGSGAPYSSPTANTTVGLLNFQLPRGVQDVSANETLLLQQIAANLGLKPSEVVTATLAAANGSTNATAVNTFLTLIGSESPQQINQLAGNVSAALKNGTVGLDPAVFGTASSIALSPALLALLGSVAPGTTLPPGTALPPGVTIPPGIVLPGGATGSTGGSTNSSAAASGATPTAGNTPANGTTPAAGTTPATGSTTAPVSTPVPGTTTAPGSTTATGSSAASGTTAVPGAISGSGTTPATGVTPVAAAGTGTTPVAPVGGATKIGSTLVGLASALLVAALF